MADEDGPRKFKKQWQERSEKPIATRFMTPDEIEEYRLTLAASYKLENSKELSFEFKKILDENDEDRDDCLLLNYLLECIWQGKHQKRIIFSLKIPLPPEIKKRAEDLKKQGPRVQRRKRTQNLPTLTNGEVGVAPSVPSGPPPPPSIEQISATLNDHTNVVESTPTVEEPPDNDRPRSRLVRPVRVQKK